ncbi:hypothetical protein BDB00DRAFT_817861 [Zychaea mexicana]|uniref:uncharacterized protein n=1 Tax=Zychaea mexicana TaxID=64656 RepID=UPI0022FE9989|nr:uncharacterized protein BDB00DRAFT_817861 [Zychaea mexicana]KAI9494688.1 hypothetical protein BDB00DRAFT_817861 [Zychaea mexicana]
MLATRGVLLQRSLQPSTAAAAISAVFRQRIAGQCLKRTASTVTTATDNAIPSGLPFMFFKQVPEAPVSQSVTEYLSQMRPFSAPPAPLQQSIHTPPSSETLNEGTMYMTSILRKRRLKMNKHKHKKLRKRTRALRKRLGK